MKSIQLVIILFATILTIIGLGIGIGLGVNWSNSQNTTQSSQVYLVQLGSLSSLNAITNRLAYIQTGGGFVNITNLNDATIKYFTTQNDASNVLVSWTTKKYN